MGNTSGKVWGVTTEVWRSPHVEVHVINVRKGGQCSRHLHTHKHNLFFVSEGVLRIEVWKNDYDLCDVTELQAGQTMVVPPGEYHRFTALEETRALEVYWAESSSSDIKRTDVGSLLPMDALSFPKGDDPNG